MDPVAYFLNIAPKLLALIDGNDPDLKRTAAYVVGNGILGKKLYGVPGGIGHSIFVEPLFKAITGELDDSSRQWLRPFNLSAENVSSRDPQSISPGDILVDETELLLAVERLATLSLQHPNPGLVKRLVQPILLPLWGLACYAQEKHKDTWYEKVFALLQTYFSLSVGLQPLKKIVDNLLWSGGPTWAYAPGRSAGISLHKRIDSGFNLVQLVESVDSRADNLSKLLGSDPQSEERTGDIFLYVSEKWLIMPSRRQPPLNEMKILREEEMDSESMTQRLVSAKIAEKLLDDFKDTLSRHPLRVLELVQQLIESELDVADERERRRARKSGKASLETLANIVPREESGSATDVDQADSEESLSATFSLLSTILASPDFSMSKTLLPILEKIKSQLDQLIPNLSASLARPGNTASMLLELHLNSPEGQQESRTAPSPHVSDLETHRQALKNITSPLPPVQAEGLSLLSNLVAKSSPVLDIPSTLSLLLSIITDQSPENAANEEFIYLNAIKLIGNLASKHPRTVVKTLVERYADKNEERTLDQRLKVGESLLRTVQDLGEAFVGETAQIIGEGMISVAGRRGRKPGAQKARKKQLEKERRQREREEGESAMPSGWKISSPALSKLEAEPSYPDEDDSDSETPEQATHSANIVTAWAAGSAEDQEPDDLRVRASAISILATAIQTNLLALGPSIASSAVDLAISTLTLEPGPESAILRRASAVLLLDIIKAMDSARETRGDANLGFGFSIAADETVATDVNGSRGPATIGNIPNILRSLAFVESRETDSVVRGHIRVLIESLEAWMEKSLLWGIGMRSQDGIIDNEPRLELGDRIAGLDLDPLAGRDRDQRTRPRIEEIE
jgi:hypothetical protein